jgi:hypothetical protein
MLKETAQTLFKVEQWYVPRGLNVIWLVNYQANNHNDMKAYGRQKLELHHPLLLQQVQVSGQHHTPATLPLGIESLVTIRQKAVRVLGPV